MAFRMARLDDVDACIDLLRSDGGWQASNRVWCALPDILRQGIACESLIVQLFTASSATTANELLALRVSGFLSEPFVARFAQEPLPYISATVCENWLEGHSPLLNRRQIADANALGSLRLGVLHWCVRDRNPASPDTMAVLAQVPSAWQAAHGGYHVASIACYEVYGAAQAAVMSNIGYQPYRFSSRSESMLAGVADELRPVCFHAEPTDARLGAAALMGVSIFQAPPPRFSLTPAQQKLVLAALPGAADRQLANLLGITFDSVRKTWEALYRRVNDVDALLLPTAGTASGHRGSEKRRVLLDYLRQHPEELRPYRRRAVAASGMRHQDRRDRVIARQSVQAATPRNDGMTP